MKKLLVLALVLAMLMGLPALAAVPEGITWDGAPASLGDIAQKLGYDMAGPGGSYKPLYAHYAGMLWEQGLFLGSAGSFDLDQPLSRAAGVVMTLRILGKAEAAAAWKGSLTFTDVPDWAVPYVGYAVESGITNGYSAQTFGSNDAMTAAQFLTFTLRAMGYQDGVDFTWSAAYDKALSIGLIGAPCHSQYSRSNLFVRDNAAMIAYNALFTAPTQAGTLLGDTIAMPGRPAGEMPLPIRAAEPSQPVEPEPQPVGDVVIEVSGLYASTPYTAQDGAVQRGEIIIDFTVLSGSGTLNYTITGHSGSATEFTSDVEAGENYRVSRKYVLSQPFTSGAGPFTLTFQGGGVTKTFTVANTNMHGKLEVVYNW